jgi:hypothetical protein
MYVLPSLSGDCVQKYISSPASQETVFKEVFFSLSGDCVQKCMSSPASQETVFKEVCPPQPLRRLYSKRYVLPSLSGDCIQRGNQIFDLCSR